MYLNPNIIKSWKYREFKKWLQDLSTQEALFYEWKSTINLNPDNLRKLFCSFANTPRGGAIFFGIDNNKRIIGVKPDSDLAVKINRIVSKNIFQPISPNSWSIIKGIRIPNTKKVVYILYVYPSLYTEKPHMFNGKVYIRENGECKAITDGRTLRKLFLIERFYPEHIKQLEMELEKIKKCRFNPDEIDIMYLKELKSYLEKKSEENEQFKELLYEFGDIVNLYEKIKKEQSIGVTKGEQISILNGDNITEYCNQLSIGVNNFIKKFKEIHKL